MSGIGWLAIAWLLCLGGALAVPALPGALRGRALGAALVAQSLAVVVLGAVALAAPASSLPLWSLGPLGRPVLALDAPAGLFLALTGLVFGLCAPHAAAEIGALGSRRAEAAFCAFYPLLLAASVLVLVAGDVVTLLFAWEVMSLLVYALALLGGGRARGAGYRMLALGEAGSLAAAGGLLLLAAGAGGSDFATLRAAASGLAPGVREAAFALALLGFGVKAGLVPVNQWLAPVYTSAPRAFTPVLAGATTPLGIYAVVRVGFDLAAGAGLQAGLLALALGASTALVGILYATIQPTLRATLAHSSIENMGLVVTALGAALSFAALGHPVVAGIALLAGLYHLVNHSLYKALLFVAAGAVERGAGEEHMDRLGGLARRMPWLGVLALIGVLGIAALPPLNGFVSEWLILQSLLRAAVLDSTAVQVAFALAGAALALTAGLAVTCFVKLYAMSFLGMARSRAAAEARPAPWSARGPLALLAAGCLFLGLAPTLAIPLLGQVVAALLANDPTPALVPPFFVPGGDLPAAFVAEFHDLGAQLGQGLVPAAGLVVLHRGGAANPVVFAMSTSYGAVVLAALTVLVWALVRVVARRPVSRRARAWDGGLRRLHPNATYTATGFSNPVRVVFDAVLRPRRSVDTARAVREHFRTAVQVERHEVHPLDRLVLEPLVAAVTRLGALLRAMHRGAVNAYAAYVLLVVIAVLVAGAYG